MSLDLDPLAVLSEDLADDSVEIQLEAINALSTVAIAMGPKRTASELFATLHKYCFPVEIQASKSPEAYSNTESLAAKEEVLAAIAEQLRPEFVEYCGGSANASEKMLPLLTDLAMVEETVIRQAAISSLCKIFPKLKAEHAHTYGLPIMAKLAEDSWFTSRCSASGLSASLYGALSEYEEDKQKILETHKKLCEDEMPMVKNEAYKNLVSLIEEIKGKNLIISYTKPLLEKLHFELMETMRQTLVDIVKKLAIKCENEEKSQDIIPVYLKIAVEDDSWRVRKHCAESISGICNRLSKKRVTEDVLPLYIKLLSDSEPQVRKSSIGQLETMLKASDGREFATQIANGTVQLLVNDSVADVRESLASQISCLGPYLGKEVAKDKLLPLLKKLASDDSPLARLNLCSKLSSVSEILGIDLFESEILPLLKEVTIDQRWRVRNSIVVNIANIGIQMGKEKFSKSRLREILIQSLKDPASTVRETAVEQVQLLNSSFGYEWMCKHLFSQMKLIYKESGNYLHRMIPLKAVKLMANDLNASQIKTQFGDLLSNALSDPISNVRFTCCRVLIHVLPRLDSNSVSLYKSRLQKMVTEDEDEDVRYFGTQAINAA